MALLWPSWKAGLWLQLNERPGLSWSERWTELNSSGVPARWCPNAAIWATCAYICVCVCSRTCVLSTSIVSSSTTSRNAAVTSIPVLPTFHRIPPCTQQGVIGLCSCCKTHFCFFFQLGLGSSAALCHQQLIWMPWLIYKGCGTLHGSPTPCWGTPKHTSAASRFVSSPV